MTVTVNHWLKTYSINILYGPITTAIILQIYWMINKIHWLTAQLYSPKAWLVRQTSKQHLITCKQQIKFEITLIFFPSSSILYSVTVFIFPLMVSLGEGRVPVGNTNRKSHIGISSNGTLYITYKLGCWKVYVQLFLMISAQYSIYITKVHLLKLNYFKMKCISQKGSWFVETRYKNNTAYVIFSGPQHVDYVFI